MKLKIHLAKEINVDSKLQYGNNPPAIETVCGQIIRHNWTKIPAMANCKKCVN